LHVPFAGIVRIRFNGSRRQALLSAQKLELPVHSRFVFQVAVYPCTEKEVKFATGGRRSRENVIPAEGGFLPHMAKETVEYQVRGNQSGKEDAMPGDK
jgi:hypothetical protein